MRLLGPIDENKDVINVEYLKENAALNMNSNQLEVYVQDTEPTPEAGKNKLWVHQMPVKTYTDIIGDSGTNNEAGCAFYFGSIRPTSWTNTWEVHYRVRVWVPSNTSYEAFSEVLFTGDQGSINAYSIFNHIYSTSYRPVYYHAVHRLKSAGYTNGYGHILGISLQDSTNRDNTSLKRSFTVEILSQTNCEITLLDTPVKYANWPGTGSTNYESWGSYNFASNGLQETGDSDTTNQLRSYYERPLVDTGKLYGYNLCTLTNNNKLTGFVTSYSTGNTKTKNTATFRIGAPIFYYGASTEKAAGTYPGDNTMILNTSGIDLRYSTNCAQTLTTNVPVYLVGIPNGANYTLADTWWTQTLPTTDDGKIYIYLGVPYSTYQLAWQPIHPVYWFKNGKLQQYNPPTISSSDVTTALGYTPYNSTNPAGYTTNTGTITGVSVNGTSIATSGVANITSMPASILSGAIPSAVTAVTQSQGDNSTKIATTAYVDKAVTDLPEPMIFKGSLGTGGTITTLPAASSSNEGFTYKVITAGTYASQTAKVGDTFISDGTTWVLIPSGDEPSGTVTSITLKATSPIAIDSSSAITTSGTRTLSHANSGVTAGTYKSVTVNATGHVTAGTNPTTLSGYGITDAKIASGTITLGSNTITPLTAASTLDATKLSGTIPSGCYTDTKNTAGSTDTSSKIFLIGATSQAANPQTYSDNEVYATSGVLTTKAVQVGGTAATMQYNSTDKCIEFVFS